MEIWMQKYAVFLVADAKTRKGGLVSIPVELLDTRITIRLPRGSERSPWQVCIGIADRAKPRRSGILRKW
jgi:hypothetical protein